MSASNARIVSWLRCGQTCETEFDYCRLAFDIHEKIATICSPLMHANQNRGFDDGQHQQKQT